MHNGSSHIMSKLETTTNTYLAKETQAGLFGYYSSAQFAKWVEYCSVQKGREREIAT